MLPSTVAADKTDSPNGGMIADGIDSGSSSVHHFNNTWWKTSALAQLCNDHCGAWVTFRRFDYDGVSCHSSHRYGPEGNHTEQYSEIGYSGCLASTYAGKLNGAILEDDVNIPLYRRG